MTGEELYALYAKLMLFKGIKLDSWKKLGKLDNAVWNDLTRLTCPEMSDEAKKI